MDLFGSSGARGPVETELRPETVLHIAQSAIAHWDVDQVAVGRDVRVSGPSLQAAAIAGASSAGADVEVVGVAPTPAIQYYADRQGIPAFAITASHNPPADNGIKLIASDGGEVSVPDYEAIEGRLRAEGDDGARWEQYGTVTRIDQLQERYIDDLEAHLDSEVIADASLRVVVDAGNGAGGYTSPTLCRRLGCDVITLNAQPDGHFPGRQSEPVPAALHDLSRMVVDTDADLGVAHDGDADRAVFVDESGSILDGGATLSAFAAAISEPGDSIVTAITAPQSIARIASENQLELEMTRVGAAHVLTRIRELRDGGRSVSIAGEQNGGMIFPRYRLSRDGAYALGKMLELVAQTPISELVEPYSDRTYRRRDIPIGSEASTDQMLTRLQRWGEEQDAAITTVDGVRVDLDDRWVLLRPSGTEPLIRLYAEAPTVEQAESLLDTIESTVV